jgi:hypothetical protein
MGDEHASAHITFRTAFCQGPIGISFGEKCEDGRVRGISSNSCAAVGRSVVNIDRRPGTSGIPERGHKNHLKRQVEGPGIELRWQASPMLRVGDASVCGDAIVSVDQLCLLKTTNRLLDQEDLAWLAPTAHRERARPPDLDPSEMFRSPIGLRSSKIAHE